MSNNGENGNNGRINGSVPSDLKAIQTNRFGDHLRAIHAFIDHPVSNGQTECIYIDDEPSRILILGLISPCRRVSTSKAGNDGLYHVIYTSTDKRIVYKDKFSDLPENSGSWHSGELRKSGK